MNNKDLLKAIGDIDEKYLIEETDIEETNRIASNNKVNIMKNLKYVVMVSTEPAIVLYLRELLSTLVWIRKTPR